MPPFIGRRVTLDREGRRQLDRQRRGDGLGGFRLARFGSATQPVVGAHRQRGDVTSPTRTRPRTRSTCFFE